MKAFAVEGILRHGKGKKEPFKASISAPAYDAEYGYVCCFETTAFHGGSFHSPFPELSYSRCISHVGRFIAAQKCKLIDGRGKGIHVQAPLFDAAGVPMFSRFEFSGKLRKQDGSLMPFNCRVEPPQPHKYGFGCLATCSLFEIGGPMIGVSPDQAYELGFKLLRSIVSGERAEFVDDNGHPQIIAATDSALKA